MAQIFLSILCFIILFVGSCSLNEKRPPNGLPEGASWAGGADGGVWIACQDGSISNEFTCAIFGENGSLWKKEVFRLIESSNKHLSARDLKNLGYSWYDGKQIKLMNGDSLILVDESKN